MKLTGSDSVWGSARREISFGVEGYRMRALPLIRG
jgi:hypothetical protein